MKVNWDITIRSHKCAGTNCGSVLIQTYNTKRPTPSSQYELIDTINIRIDSEGRIMKP